MNLVEAFLKQVEARPDAPALITPDGRVVSYAELSKASASRAHTYECSGINAGDVILIARGVSVELYETLLAVFRLGAVAMFPEPAAGIKGLRLAIQAVRPKAMVTAGIGGILRFAFPETRALKLLPNPRGDEPGRDILAHLPGSAPALITFTSGSTGRPKGIVRSSDFLMLQHALLEKLRQTTPQDVDLISLPVFILSNLAAGAASVIPAGKLTRPAQLNGARLRKQMEEHRVNRIVAPPAVCGRIAEGAPPMSQLSAVFTGGGPVFPNLLHSIAKAAPRAAVHAVYGSTEAEPIAHVELKEIADRDWEAMASGAGLLAGKPIPEIEVDIRDHEVFVAGPHVNEGYLNPEDDKSTKSRRDGKLWHRTGDAARMDDKGRLWLLGRREAAHGGLFPFAIETAALSWPGVSQAALLAGDGKAKLALAGEFDLAALQARAAKLGDIEIVQLKAIPMDKRHNSKADYAALRKLLA
ncbi:MAG TPA: AMP-binding protein [Hyphomonadaceae bacterium]|nr:AMP-binding protein [Hyphomonadaceae bacterium]